MRGIIHQCAWGTFPFSFLRIVVTAIFASQSGHYATRTMKLFNFADSLLRQVLPVHHNGSSALSQNVTISSRPLWEKMESIKTPPNQISSLCSSHQTGPGDCRCFHRLTCLEHLMGGRASTHFPVWESRSKLCVGAVKLSRLLVTCACKFVRRPDRTCFRCHVGPRLLSWLVAVSTQRQYEAGNKPNHAFPEDTEHVHSSTFPDASKYCPLCGPSHHSHHVPRRVASGAGQKQRPAIN